VSDNGLALTQLTLRAPNATLALDRVSLDIPRGVFLTLLGAPGAGKSALLAALAGFARPTQGDISLNAQSLRRVRPNRRGFGVVSRDPALFPHLTLAENIAYPLRLRGTRRADRNRMVDAALDSVLLHDGGRMPHQATPAEHQRAAWARATIFGPRALLLDEPLALQSPADRALALAALRRLHLMLGVPTVMATNNPADALALSDRIAVLHQGRVEQTDEPAKLYANPISAIAARASGEANLLPGTIARLEDDGTARVTLACGPAIEATAPRGLFPRDRCLVCLRPEQIAVALTRAEDMGEGALDATVLEVLNLGDAVRLRLLLGAGEALVVRRPAGVAIAGLSPGEPVAVAWQPHHGLILPAK
jgi:putative spermidine/putrescine transport system ATP-binding protein